MDKFWLEKARKYILEHRSFFNVSDVIKDNEISTITADIHINLPSQFLKGKITSLGIKEIEPVTFKFQEDFPLSAPRILLRSDFPRNFPHINPSKSEVNPCIYEGNLSELLQQSEWMNGILNQLVDWLEKAASNDLINYEQGWEPMRNDEFKGFIIYDVNDTISAFKSEGDFFKREIKYEEKEGFIVTDSLCDSFKKKYNAHLLFFKTKGIYDKYYPNYIKKLQDLFEFSDIIDINSVKRIIEDYDKKFINEDKLFVIIAIQRPVNLINTDNNIEFLNFVINKSLHRKKGKKELKRVLPDCEINMLSHVNDTSQKLLRILSGTRKIEIDQSIALIGCGSLGSKIGLHLARNGIGPFYFVDNDIFLPHNNARHSLSMTSLMNKADLMNIASFSINKSKGSVFKDSAIRADYSKSKLIIDTTASMAVRNFLFAKNDLPCVISGCLYDGSRHGILFIESKSKKIDLIDLWAFIYYKAVHSDEIRNILFNDNITKVNIGQTCSSNTLIASDSNISQIASTMSLKIQDLLEDDLPSKGEILLIKATHTYSLESQTIEVDESVKINPDSPREWQVRISKNIYEEMLLELKEYSPREIGGVLIGSVFMYPKVIIITGMIEAPKDSISRENFFELGIEGLQKRISYVERRTNGKVTYLGTWHSHPKGGNASTTDHNTLGKLEFIRNYEPTVCLIVTPKEIIQV
jgi:integrative and conjugative element protein (TIGR02256 family)